MNSIKVNGKKSVFGDRGEKAAFVAGLDGSIYYIIIPTICRPSGLVGNLHTCWCGSREVDSCPQNLGSFFRSGKRENASK